MYNCEDCTKKSVCKWVDLREDLETQLEKVKEVVKDTPFQLSTTCKESEFATLVNTTCSYPTDPFMNGVQNVTIEQREALIKSLRSQFCNMRDYNGGM